MTQLPSTFSHRTNSSSFICSSRHRSGPHSPRPHRRPRLRAERHVRGAELDRARTPREGAAHLLRGAGGCNSTQLNSTQNVFIELVKTTKVLRIETKEFIRQPTRKRHTRRKHKNSRTTNRVSCRVQSQTIKMTSLKDGRRGATLIPKSATGNGKNGFVPAEPPLSSGDLEYLQVEETVGLRSGARRHQGSISILNPAPFIGFHSMRL